MAELTVDSSLRAPLEPLELDPEPPVIELELVQDDPRSHSSGHGPQRFGKSEWANATQEVSHYAAGGARLEPRAILQKIDTLHQRGAYAEAANELTKLEPKQLAALLTGARLDPGKPGLDVTGAARMHNFIDSLSAQKALDADGMFRIGMAYATGSGRSFHPEQAKEFLRQLSQDKVWPWDFHRVAAAFQSHGKLTAKDIEASWRPEPGTTREAISLTALVSSSPLLMKDLAAFEGARIRFKPPAVDANSKLFAGDSQPADLDYVEGLRYASDLAHALSRQKDPVLLAAQKCRPTTSEKGAEALRDIEGRALLHQVMVQNEIQERTGTKLKRTELEHMGFSGTDAIRTGYQNYQQKMARKDPAIETREQAIDVMGRAYFDKLKTSASNDPAEDRFNQQCPRPWWQNTLTEVQESVMEWVKPDKPASKR